MADGVKVGGQGDLTVLSDPHHVRSDLQMVGRAIRLRWPTTPDVRHRVVQRLDGLIDSEDDEIAMGACSRLSEIEKQNQRDDHKQADLDAPSQTNIQVNIAVRRIVIEPEPKTVEMP